MLRGCENIYLEEKSLYRFGVFTSKMTFTKVIFPVFKPKSGFVKFLRWIHIHLVGSLHLELIHGGTGLGIFSLLLFLLDIVSFSFHV